MPKTNRKCKACGTDYYFCPSCNNKNEPNWKILFDTENCKKVFSVTNDFGFNNITADEANSILKTCDTNVNFSDSIVKMINKINEETSAVSKIATEFEMEKEVIKEALAEEAEEEVEEVVEEATEDIVDEVVTIVKESINESTKESVEETGEKLNYYSRKRNKRN